MPETPKTTFTVGTVVGGSTVNSIAAKATMEIDTRSINNDELNKIVDQVLPLLTEACEEENKHWNAADIVLPEISLTPVRFFWLHAAQ